MKRMLLGAASLAATVVVMSMPSTAAAQTADVEWTPCSKPIVECVRDLLVCAPPGCLPPPGPLVGRVCEEVFGDCG